MKSLPGYRFDESTNRYYREEPASQQRFIPTQREKSLPATAIAENPKPGEAGKRRRTTFVQPTFDARWVLQRACRNIRVREVENRPMIPIGNLCVSPKFGECVAGTHDKMVFIRNATSSLWECRITGETEAHHNNVSSLVNNLERLNEAILQWHPFQQLLLFAGGREQEEYVQLVSSSDTTSDDQQHPMIRLGFEPLCGTWHSQGKSAIILTTAKRKGCLVDFENGTRLLDIPKFQSDALSCTYLNENTLSIGLRQGKTVLWDVREKSVLNDLTVNAIGAPVRKLVKSRSCDHLIFVYAPNGLREENATCLVDVRFPKSPVATFELRARSSTPFPMVSNGELGDLIFALDDRTERFCRIFELDNARHIVDVDCSDLGNCISFAVLGESTSRISILASTPSTLITCETEVD